jgi:hypothetical protein
MDGAGSGLVEDAYIVGFEENFRKPGSTVDYL